MDAKKYDRCGALYVLDIIEARVNRLEQNKNRAVKIIVEHAIHEHINESPTIYKNSDILGHVTKVTRNEDGQTFDIKLNENGRQFVNDIYKKQKLDRDDKIKDLIEWDDIWNEIWNEIYKEDYYGIY